MILFAKIIFGITLISLIILWLVVYLIERKLNKISSADILSGFEIAKLVCTKINKEPHIIKKNGKYLDHYNIDRDVIKLSKEVFDGQNMYSTIIALDTALDAHPKRKLTLKIYNICSFTVLISYILFILGCFLNDYDTIYFSLIIFSLPIITAYLSYSLYEKNEDNRKEIYSIIKSLKIFKNFNEYKNYISLLAKIRVITLPFSFITGFR